MVAQSAERQAAHQASPTLTKDHALREDKRGVIKEESEEMERRTTTLCE